MSNRQGRSALFLAGVALMALAISLVLAFAPVPRQRSEAPRTTAQTLHVTATAGPPRASMSAGTPTRPMLWTLLAPWALRVDALAVLGAAVVLALCIGAQRGGRART